MENQENPIPIDAVRRALVNMAPADHSSGVIPRPNYNDPFSRQRYAESFRKKYAEGAGWDGPGMGDYPLRLNEKPAFSDLTSKELSDKVASKYGLDPALLYTTVMHEGMSGIYKGEKNLKGTVDYAPDKNYPLSAQWTFGLDSFLNKYPDLVKQGRLPKDFSSQFKSILDPMKATNYAYFKNPEAGMTAAAAMWKGHYDDVDNYAKSKGIKLSPKARDFIAMVGFNAGEGTAHKMMEDYNRNGILQNDAFMKARPTSGQGIRPESYADTYMTAKKRLAMAKALKDEKYFENADESAPPINPKIFLRVKNK